MPLTTLFYHMHMADFKVSVDQYNAILYLTNCLLFVQNVGNIAVRMHDCQDNIGKR